METNLMARHGCGIWGERETASPRHALSPKDTAVYWTFPARIARHSMENLIMGSECAICGKKPVLGNQYKRRGKAKYLGGVGRKPTGITRRTFRPNLQGMQIVLDGAVQRAKVCVQCIRSGRVQRPQKKKPFQMPTM